MARTCAIPRADRIKKYSVCVWFSTTSKNRTRERADRYVATVEMREAVCLSTSSSYEKARKETFYNILPIWPEKVLRNRSIEEFETPADKKQFLLESFFEERTQPTQIAMRI